jgi:hypothetical protein
LDACQVAAGCQLAENRDSLALAQFCRGRLLNPCSPGEIHTPRD